MRYTASTPEAGSICHQRGRASLKKTSNHLYTNSAILARSLRALLLIVVTAITAAIASGCASPYLDDELVLQAANSLSRGQAPNAYASVLEAAPLQSPVSNKAVCAWLDAVRADPQPKSESISDSLLLATTKIVKAANPEDFSQFLKLCGYAQALPCNEKQCLQILRAIPCPNANRDHETHESVPVDLDWARYLAVWTLHSEAVCVSCLLKGIDDTEAQGLHEVAVRPDGPPFLLPSDSGGLKNWKHGFVEEPPKILIPAVFYQYADALKLRLEDWKPSYEEDGETAAYREAAKQVVTVEAQVRRETQQLEKVRSDLCQAREELKAADKKERLLRARVLEKGEGYDQYDQALGWKENCLQRLDELKKDENVSGGRVAASQNRLKAAKLTLKRTQRYPVRVTMRAALSSSSKQIFDCSKRLVVSSVEELVRISQESLREVLNSAEQSYFKTNTKIVHEFLRSPSISLLRPATRAFLLLQKYNKNPDVAGVYEPLWIDGYRLSTEDTLERLASAAAN